MEVGTLPIATDRTRSQSENSETAARPFGCCVSRSPFENSRTAQAVNNYGRHFFTGE
jgi:hypothetical protein